MFILSLLFPDYDPGCIMLLELGIAVPLKKFWTIYFSGLRWHTGSMPTAPPGARKVSPRAIRIALVGYSPSASFDYGQALSFFASLPTRDERVIPAEPANEMTSFRITPEMVGTP